MRSRIFRERKYKPRYFPFSAGIPWKIERGKYIIPEIDSETWFRVLEGKNLIILCFGNILESLFSLSAAEALFALEPIRKPQWLGYDKYSYFVRSQGLCKLSLIEFPVDLLRQYPVPLFFDKEDNAYLNVLTNIGTRISYWGKYPEAIDLPITEQIFKNVMVPWNNYIPKFRNIESNLIDEFSGKITSRTKYVVIIREKNVQNDVLEWNVQNIKEFAQLIGRKGIKTIVFDEDYRNYYGTGIIAIGKDIRKIVQVLSNAWMVLSSNIQWLLVSLMISRAKVVSKQIDGSYDLFRNAEFLGVSNDIFTDRNHLWPIDVFSICEGLL